MAESDVDHDAHIESRRHARRRERLIDRLPSRLTNVIRWLLKPESRWARIPAGLFLILGGFLSILPVFGLWMLPLGVILIAEDVPSVRNRVERAIDWIEKHRPHWFSGREDD